MAIAVACKCGKRFQVKDEHAGKKGKCPACGAVLVIPGRGEGVPTARRSDEDAAAGPASVAPPPAAEAEAAKTATARAVANVKLLFSKADPKRSLGVRELLLVAAVGLLFVVVAATEAPRDPDFARLPEPKRTAAIVGAVAGAAVLGLLGWAAAALARRHRRSTWGWFAGNFFSGGISTVVLFFLPVRRRPAALSARQQGQTALAGGVPGQPGDPGPELGQPATSAGRLRWLTSEVECASCREFVKFSAPFCPNCHKPTPTLSCPACGGTRTKVTSQAKGMIGGGVGALLMTGGGAQALEGLGPGLTYGHLVVIALCVVFGASAVLMFVLAATRLSKRISCAQCGKEGTPPRNPVIVDPP